MNKAFNLLSISFLLFLTYPKAHAQSDLGIIRKRIETEILAPGINQTYVEKLMNTLSEDGSWPDINYKDVSRTGFQNAVHLRRLVDLSRAYKKEGSIFKDNEKLKKNISQALDFWLVHDFICDNWWWNQIGTPGALVKVLLIMDHDLTNQQISNTIPIVSRATLKNIPGTFYGARESGDRVKIAGIVAKRLLFQGNELRLDSVIKIIEGELKFTTGRGLQYDYSYHHRDDKVNNTLTYGKQYADVLADWAAKVRGTELKFSAKHLHELVDYYLDGICKMMVYGKYPDPGAENRDITRRGSLRPFSPVTPENLLKVTDYREKELEQIVKIRNGKAQPELSFSKFFWATDYFTFQRPSFFTSVRMYSDRDYNMEYPYNGEGLMNHYRGDGTNYISRTGREYDGLSPVYDWQKIPGTTVMLRTQMPPPDEIQKKGLTDFVGGVTNGRFGAVGFDFRSPLDPLKAKKSWFFFDKEYVCLGTGISSDSTLPVVTTLNQCLLTGDILVGRKNGSHTVSGGLHKWNDIQWIWHDSIGYVFLEPDRVVLSTLSQLGSWYKVNHSESSPKQDIRKAIFKLWINHGYYPRGAAYQYMVVPAISKQGIKKIHKNHNIKVLSNTKKIQAVRNTKLNIFEGVFYEPGSIHISESLRLTMNDPGIIMIRSKGKKIISVSVEDPTHHLKRIHFSLSAKIKQKGKKEELISSSWDKGGKVSHVTIQLPQNVYRGKSVTIDFN